MLVGLVEEEDEDSRAIMTVRLFPFVYAAFTVRIGS